MGRTLDILLRRTSRQISKLKALLGLTVSRIAVLSNHRRIRCTQARGDVAQILQLGQLDRALLRVEQVIKEQNMLDAFAIIESYCNLVIERASLFERTKECPEELREAVSCLIFAASRCGDLPELQGVRSIFSSKFGREFTSAATELRNNCGVNPKIIQKLSTRQPSLEIREKVTQQIAAEKGIKVDFDESFEIAEVKSNLNNSMKQNLPMDHISKVLEVDRDEDFSIKGHKKYTDAATAAQAAFESAAFAAAAAKAAVELSRAESQGKGSDDQSSRRSQRKSELEEPKEVEDDDFAGIKHAEKVQHVEDISDSEEETPTENNELLFKKEGQLERSSSTSSASIELPSEENHASPTDPALEGQEILFDEIDRETDRSVVGKRKPFVASSRDLNLGGEDEQIDAPLDDDSTNKHHISYMQVQPPYRRENKMTYAEEEIPIENDELLSKKEVQLERSSSSSSASIELPSKENHASPTDPALEGQEILFDESDRATDRSVVRKRTPFVASSRDLNFGSKDEQIDAPLDYDSTNKHHVSYMQLQPPYRRENKMIYAEEKKNLMQNEVDKKGLGSRTKDGIEMYNSETKSQSQKFYLKTTADMSRPTNSNVRMKPVISMRTRRGGI